MAELLTLDQVHDARLPGFNVATSIEECLDTGTDWQTVLSLTLISGDSPDYRVFTAIRDRSTNSTHPDIVSTPTGRMPKQIAQALITDRMDGSEDVAEGWSFEGIVDPTKPIQVANFSGSLVDIPDNETMLPYVVSSLLAKKLGCSEALEKSTKGNPLGTVSLATVMAGFSFASEDAHGEALFEPLLMLGAVVHLNDPAVIPKNTESYRESSWIGLDDFSLGLKEKNSNLMIPGLTENDQIDVCVRGLCLATSQANITSSDSLFNHLP